MAIALFLSLMHARFMYPCPCCNNVFCITVAALCFRRDFEFDSIACNCAVARVRLYRPGNVESQTR